MSARPREYARAAERIEEVNSLVTWIATGACCAAMLWSRLGNAETLSGKSPNFPIGLGSCGDFTATVLRWTPQNGPPAAFVARNFVQQSGELWIGLGYDDRGFWSAEARDDSDACDDCDSLSLVHTYFGGARKVFSVAHGQPDLQGMGPDARMDLVQRRLFALARTAWPVHALKHDYQWVLPAHDSRGNVLAFSGWMAQVSRPGRFHLRFRLDATSTMCWCQNEWSGYPIAP